MDLMTATDENDGSKCAGRDQMDDGSNEGHESLSDAAAEKRRASRIELSENEGEGKQTGWARILLEWRCEKRMCTC